MDKLLDLRFVIGLFFVILSILLLLHSFISSDISAGQQAINRWCGIVFGFFGILMIVLSFKKDAHDELT